MSTKQQSSTNNPEVANSSGKKRSVLKIMGFSLFGLITLVVLLVVSPWGNRLALSVADASLDELSIDYVSGGIFSDLHLRSVNWQQQGTQARLQDVKLDISIRCLLSFALCIDNLSVASIDGSITPSSAPAEPSKEPLQRIVMPLPIQVKRIQFGQLNLTVEQQLDVSWQSLQGQLDFDQVLQVEQFLIAGLKVKTYPAPESATKAPQQATVTQSAPTKQGAMDFSQFTYQPITSLPVELPLHFSVKQFELSNFTLELPEQAVQVFETITLQASGDEQQVNLQKLFLKHPKGQLQAGAVIGLEGDLEHQINLLAKGEIQPQQQGEISVSSAGNLDNLIADIRLSGPFELTTQVEAKLSNEKLPLLLNTQWQALKWPLDNPNFESANGEILLKGNLAELTLAVATQVTGQDIPDTKLRLSGVADLYGKDKQLSIDQLLVATLEGTVSSQGQLQLTDSLDWRGNTRIQGINVESFFPNVPAQLNGELIVTANNQQGVWQGTVQQLGIDGAWMDYPLIVKGKVDFHQLDGLSVEQFLVTSGQNKIELSGTLDKQQNIAFEFDFDAPNINQSVPDVSGAISVNGKVLGSLQEPKVSYQLKANELAVADVKVQQIGGGGSLVWDDSKPLALDLSVANIVLAGHQVDKASIQLSGDASDHQLLIVSEGEQLDIDLLINGKLTSDAWHGHWQKAKINTRFADLSLKQPFSMNADWSQQKYSISSHCWQQRQGQLCINQANFIEQQASWDLSLTNFDWASILQKLELEGPTVDTQSVLNVASQGTWSQAYGPIASLDMALSPGTWTISQQQSVSLDLSSFTLNAQATAKDLTADMQLMGSELGELALQFKGDSEILKQDLSKPIDGKLFLSGVNLAAFKALVPELEQLQGVLKGDTTISGTLSKPMLKGELALEDGAVKGEGLPVSLSEVNQRITLQGQQAKFDGSYKFGEGYGEMTGQLSWLPELAGNILLKGDNLEVNHQDMVKARISPDINLTFSEQNIDLQGEIKVPYARVKIRELPPGSISPSTDVIMVEQEQKNKGAQQLLDMNLLIRVDAQKRNDVKLDAYGLTSDLRGELRVTNNVKGMFAHGELSLVNGRYRGNGQNLVIREGDISFNGSLDRPYLNIEAVRDPLLTEDGVIAGLRVQGEAERPKVEIFSEPEMEQQQSLSYMLTGRGIGESSDDSQDTVITNTLLAIGLGQSENLVSKVGNKLGFEDVAFDTSGQGDETQLSLTGTIAPGVQLRYGVGVFDSVSEVAIRYELLPKLYLEAVSSLTNAVDLYYQFSIEGSQNKKLFKAQQQAEKKASD